MEEAPIEPEQLCWNWVEKSRSLQDVVLLLIAELDLLLIREEIIGGKATHEHKDNGDNDQNRQQRLQQPLDRVLKHYEALALYSSTNRA